LVRLRSGNVVEVDDEVSRSLPYCLDAIIRPRPDAFINSSRPYAEDDERSHLLDKAKFIPNDA